MRELKLKTLSLVECETQRHCVWLNFLWFYYFTGWPAWASYLSQYALNHYRNKA